ncbi:MAG: alpha/beta hydrolase family protein [Acidobacteriota bacterium]
MRRVAITWALALLFLGFFVTPSHAQQTSLHGAWIGQIDFGRQWQRINFNFTNEKEGLKGMLDFPEQGRNGLPLKSIVVNSSHVRIEWQGRSGVATYDGQINGNKMTGEFKQGDSKGTFRLVRVANPTADLKLYGEYTGSYQLGPDRFVDLAPFSENEDRPIFYDSKTHRTGVLYALSETEFFSGQSYGVMFPMDIRVTFVRNKRGEVSGLTWQEGGFKVIQAKKVSPYRSEEITFHNGEVTLRGTLTMPATKGPHPAIILVHGSGPQRRPGGHWTHYFTRYGIAYFNFDKRGSGASTGDLYNASLNDLAGDVLAAVQAIRGNKQINPNQVGLIGHSNGGWVAPLAASRSRDVAFVIVKSGSGLPVHENLVYELEMDMRAAGNFSKSDIAQARAIREQLNKALLTNSGWEALMANIEKSKNERWFQYARVQWLPHVPPPLDSTANNVLSGFRSQIDFDPAKTWEQVHCPVLVLLGELDANVPSKASAAIMERGLKSGGNRDYSVRVLSKANHGLFEAETGYSPEWPLLKRYVPGYMDGITDWLRKRVQ